jgi:hypothetical protein
MSFDASRFTFDPWNDYVGVVMQQGRVQLDQDWNEWVAEVVRRMQAGTVDILGTAAVPRATTPNGFNITPSATSSGAFTMTIGRGRIYVDGLLAENHGLPPPSPLKWTDGSQPEPAAPALLWDPLLDEVTGSTDVPYDQQPYYFAPMQVPLPTTAGPHVVYLDVWQRELTHLQRPDLVEKAVNVDTTERLQTVWQVKVLANTGAGTSCGTDLGGLLNAAGIHPSASRLTSDAVDVPLPTDPCQIPSASGFKGLENQLYRVEIHQDSANAGGASFKWSRDNATIAALVLQITAADTLVVQSVGRDDVLRFNPLDWIEITDDWQELNGLPGEVHQIKSIEDATRTITLQTALAAPASYPVDGQGNTDAARHTRIRRWDQSGKVLAADGTTVYWDLDNPASAAVPAGTIPVPPVGTQVMLENGVLVSFSLDAAIKGGILAARDFWCFAVRAVDGTVEKLNAAPPRGIHHHYTQLAVVTFPGGVSDCRTLWPPLPGGGAACCCDVTVGPSDIAGKTTLQSIVDQFKTKPGSAVCLEAGDYQLAAPIVLSAAHSGLSLKGCGGDVTLSVQKGSEAAFQDGVIVIVGASDVVLENLRIAIPEVPYVPPKGTFAGLPLAALPPDVASVIRQLVVSIGVRAIDSTALSIKGCAFEFGDFEEDIPNKTGFGIGVFGGGQNDGLILEGNTFGGVAPFLAGYLLAPAVSFNPPHTVKRPPRPPIRLPGGINRFPVTELAATSATVASAPEAAARKTAASKAAAAANATAATTTTATTTTAASSKTALGNPVLLEAVTRNIELLQAVDGLRSVTAFAPQTQNLAAAGGQVLVPRLASASIRENNFSGLDIAALILAKAGAVDFSANQVDAGGGGLWVIDPQYETLLAYNSTMLLGSLVAGGYALPAEQGIGTIAITSVNAAPAPVRIFAGAQDFTDSTGDVWAPDTNTAEVAVSGGILNRPTSPPAIGKALPATSDQALYQSERYGNFSYTFSHLPEGYYQVRLKFAEIFDKQAGQRVFDVSINGNRVLQNFDVFATAGGADIAVDQTFGNIAPSSGEIVIEFDGTGSVDPNPKIGAVEIASQLYQFPNSLNETGQFLAQLAALGAQPFAGLSEPALDFRVDANHMNDLSAAGLLIFNSPDQAGQGSVTVNGNVVRLAAAQGDNVLGYFLSPTFLVEMNIATVTGNQLLNANSEGYGLHMLATEQYPKATVTGNVLNGRCVLPARNLGTTVPAPMNTWRFMNTIF